MAAEKKSAIESMILSREGYSEINKLCTYLASLVVKNDSEACEYETDYTFNNYSKYEASYQDSRSIYAYTYTEEELELFFSRDTINSKNLRNPDVINELIEYGNTEAISFLEFLQTRFLNNYIEYNQYYRQFMGQPMDMSDRIAVLDLDSGKENDYVAIHEVTQTKYPKTYDYYFIKRNIESIIEEYPDLVYLKFLESPISPYLLRRSPDFTIFYSNDGLLDSDELYRFKRAYNKARIYVSEQLYAIGVARRFPIYGNLVFLLILFYTVNNYFNLKLEDYSLRKYTRYDIYDILESNGLSNLTAIDDLSMLRQIVMQMDELNQYKGTEHVLKIIFKILNDNSIVVKRSTLVKDYRTLNTGDLEFDTSQLYRASVGLKFIDEAIAVSDTNVSNIAAVSVDYDSKTYFDNMWGGCDDQTPYDSKQKIKAALKNEILKKDFNSLKSKYISISKSINLVEKSADTINILYMVLKYYYDFEEIKEGNPFKDESVTYTGMEGRPIDMFAAFCYLNNVINEVENPWEITHDRNFLSSIHLMRSTSGLLGQLKSIQDTEIDIGDPILNKTIGELIYNEEELKSYLVSYNITNLSTLSDILVQFDQAKSIFDKLKEKINTESNALMNGAFKALYNYNIGTYDFTEVFEGFTDYREFIRKNNPALIDYIEKLIGPVIAGRSNPIEVISEPLDDLTEVIEAFMNKCLDGEKVFGFSSAREDNRYLSDLKVLLKEYLSIFSELYTVETTIEIDDSPNNYLHFSYFQLSKKYILSWVEKLQFRYTLLKRMFKTAFSDNLSIREKWWILIRGNFEDEVKLKYELVDSYVGTQFFDKINFLYRLLNINVKRYHAKKIGFAYKLIDFKHKN